MTFHCGIPGFFLGFWSDRKYIALMEKAMLLLGLWTIICGLVGVGSRLFAVKKGKLNPQKFKILEASDMPPYVLRTHKHLTNLFEFPVIFYMVCLLILVKDLPVDNADQMAWMYVGFRLIHSLIHLGPNILPLRTLAYVGSQITLAVLAIHALLKLG